MENMQNAIEVRNVKKYFKVYMDRGITLKDRVVSRGRTNYEMRQVLKGISFDIKKGEAIGLIGRNGCGKSTTLKLLSKIIYPNEGTIELAGRVSSLLELGAGFHQDMSGRENIYMNAAVFGLTRKEIESRVNDIIEFSELEDYIDNPVRTYSSGMYMRLAFSVAINVDADILLVDEILAVGDVSFQRKCFDRLKQIKSQGTTIVVVSHSFDQIERICDRSIWIKDGVITEEGIPKVVHGHYYEYMENSRVARQEEERERKLARGSESRKISKKASAKVQEKEVQQGLEPQTPEEAEMVRLKQGPNLFLDVADKRHGNQKVQITGIWIDGTDKRHKLVFHTGDSVSMLVEIKANQEDLRGTLSLGIHREDGVYCYGTNTFIEKQRILELSEGRAVLIRIKSLDLLPGEYRFTVGMHDDVRADFYDQVDRAIPFQVVDEKGDLGICKLRTQWTYIEK